MLETGFAQRRGFTLIEVLVSMIILGVGLLGLAAMQAITLRDNQDTYFFSQANLIAYEMADRIKANPAYWSEQVDANGNDVLREPPEPSYGNGCNSSGSPCTFTEMAANDLFYWQDSVQRLLPAPKVGQRTEIWRGPCPPHTESGRSTICLTIRWARSNASISTDDIEYRLEVTP